MKNQQQYSHGLLYCVSPEHISTLHLLDERGHDDFDWKSYESDLEGDSFLRDTLNFINRIVAKAGIGKV